MRTDHKILNYTIDHDKKIIFSRLKGKINIDELLSFQRIKMSDPEYSNEYSCFVDIQDVNFDIDRNKREEFRSFINAMIYQKIPGRKCCFVTNNPSGITSAELFILKFEPDVPFCFKVFSSKEAAFAWIGNN
jgi:hypothetical protein